MSYKYEHELYKPSELVIWTSARSDWEIIALYTDKPQSCGVNRRLYNERETVRRTDQIIGKLRYTARK
jgi:hypothetical protein